MPEKIGIAIGKNTHWLIVPDGTGKEFQETPIANTAEGLELVMEFNPETVVFSGNREWGIPLATALQQEEVEVFYAPRSKMTRGVRQNFRSFLKAAFEKGFPVHPFFRVKKPHTGEPGVFEPDHPWYRLALEYLSATNQGRRLKHLILSSLAVLFPEAVRPSREELTKGLPVQDPLPPDIWTKKMSRVLQDPNPASLENDLQALQEVRELAKNSLGKKIPGELREHYSKLLQQHYRELLDWEKIKKESMARLKKEVAGHRLLELFPVSDSVVVLAGLVGWQEWPRWERLRKFAGLTLDRVEGGTHRISRERPSVRQYLFLLGTRTDLGREVSRLGRTRKQKKEDEAQGEEAKQASAPKVKKPRGWKVKGIERLLKYLWRECLRPKQVISK